MQFFPFSPLNLIRLLHPLVYNTSGVLEKINQDRGCVVYPYNNKRNQALFMVLDGHGEQGDKVSEFVMRQVHCVGYGL